MDLTVLRWFGYMNKTDTNGVDRDSKWMAGDVQIEVRLDGVKESLGPRDRPGGVCGVGS